MVDRVIKAYLSFCKDELRCGHRVNFFDMAMVVPDYEVYDYKTTFAYKCRQVAIDSNLPETTVLYVIREYLGTIRDDILNGKSANIFGIMTMTPYFEEGVVTRLHSSISQTLQSYLSEYSNHARVYTNKRFKRYVKGVEIHDRKDT